MFDYDDDLPPVKANLRQQWVESRDMLRSLVAVSLAAGTAVGVATTLGVVVFERMRRAS